MEPLLAFGNSLGSKTSDRTKKVCWKNKISHYFIVLRNKFRRPN